MVGHTNDCVIYQKKMQEVKSLTPKLTKKPINMSSPTLNKDKLYLPSRYALDPTRSNANMQTLLNSIELNAREEPKIKLNSPLKTLPLKERKLQLGKKKQTVDFKPKPLKRQESDMQNFKQIFLEPRQQVLTQIQQKSKSQQIVYAKQVCKDYQRLLQFEKGHTLSPSKDKSDDIQQTEVKKHFQECIELLEDQGKLSNSHVNFYDEQIRVEPPDMPNSSIASTISPGSGYAPSVPLLPSKKGTLTELLMRAKAGMSTEDIQKQAHLAFYLGMVYQQKRSYHSAVKFYKRFLGFAKAMQDKIGMALGANRVAVNLFYQNQIAKSIAFHHQNLKLSDNQNCFAAYYNLGICHRAQGEYEDSLSYLETALEWVRQKGEAQSQCITLGQMAVTYRTMEYYQKALQHFQKSADICRRLKKTNLLEQNLLEMLLIIGSFNLSTSQNLLAISTQAYQCSKLLQQKRNQQFFGCNIGIIKGRQDFAIRMIQQQFPEQFQQVGLTEQELKQNGVVIHQQDCVKQQGDLIRDENGLV